MPFYHALFKNARANNNPDDTRYWTSGGEYVGLFNEEFPRERIPANADAEIVVVHFFATEAELLRFHQQMVVLANIIGIDSSRARHAQMEHHRVAPVGVNQPIFGAPPQRRYPRPGEPLSQVNGKRPAKVSAPRFDPAQLAALEHMLEPADGGFDFGQFGHGHPLQKLGRFPPPISLLGRAHG